MAEKAINSTQNVRSKDMIRIASQSIWNERHSQNLNFYCPVCTVPRRIGKRHKVGHPIHFIQVGLTAAVATLATWPLFGIKGIVSFLPLWVIFEVIYRAKTRSSLVCERCGFDPYLYLVDAPKARDAILAKRSETASSEAPIDTEENPLSDEDDRVSPNAETS